jgi:hypothetical protein
MRNSRELLDITVLQVWGTELCHAAAAWRTCSPPAPDIAFTASLHRVPGFHP